MQTAFKLQDTNGREFWVPGTTYQEALDYYNTGVNVIIIYTDNINYHQLDTAINFSMETKTVSEIIRGLDSEQELLDLIMRTEELYMLANQLNIVPLKAALAKYVPAPDAYSNILKFFHKSSSENLLLLKFALRSISITFMLDQYYMQSEQVEENFNDSIKVLKRFNLLTFINSSLMFLNPDPLKWTVLNYSLADLISNNDMYTEIFLYSGAIKNTVIATGNCEYYLKIIENIEQSRDKYIKEVLPKIRPLIQVNIQEAGKIKNLPPNTLDQIIKDLIINEYDSSVTDNNVRKLINYVMSGQVFNTKEEFLDYIFVE